MVRLAHRSGAVVAVSDEKVDRLLGSGFSRVQEPAPKKSAPKKADDSTDK